MKIKVAIIDTTASDLFAMLLLLEGKQDIECVADIDGTDSEEDILEVLQAVVPQVVFLSVFTLDKAALNLLPKIRKILPGARILVRSFYWSEGVQILALKHGANACIDKKIFDGVAAIREVIKDDLSMILGLTSKESEVINIGGLGKLYKEIASDLKIKMHTVSHHFYKIYKKLGVNNRTEALNIVFPRPIS